MHKPLISAKNLHKTYNGKVPVPVLSGVNLEIFPNETVAIMGKSGEGKTTLLHVLCGLESPTSGQVEYPSSFGIIFQAYHLMDDETAIENVLLPARVARKKADQKKALFLLEEVGLKDKAKTRANLLSGGEKQRLGIARALMNDPDIILADEPTGNLDGATSKAIQKLLFRCTKKFGKSLLVVTHDAEFAGQCDRTLGIKTHALYNPEG